MRLLVTGASGLVGRHVGELAAADPEIDLIVTARTRPQSLATNVEFVAADLGDATAAAHMVRECRPSHIIHCAWETSHPTYYDDLVNLDWIVSAARMAQAFAEIGGTRFVQVGSCAEYEWGHGLCIEGVTPDRPATRYGQAKLAAMAAIEAAALNRFEAVEARLFWVFGPGENEQRFIPQVCQAYARGEVPALTRGAQRRDLLHARDAATALLGLARADGVTGVVNAASGEATSLATVARLIADAAGSSETGLGLLPDRIGDPPLLSAANERLKAIGWHASASLSEQLIATFEFWRSKCASEH